MKPDKIYIQEGAILRTEKTYDNDVCYIRKDYLLKWLDGEVKHYLNSEEYDFGWNMAIQKLIDKLNEI